MRTPSLRQSKILLIDDEVEVVELLRHILQLDGYRHIESTTDPLAAVSLFKECQPDLIVLDLMMPGLDGLQVLAQLRAIIPAEAYLPILVVTANTASDTRQEALALGASDFVAKPFDVTEFVARIGNMLETRFLHLQPLLESQRFLQATLDALSSHIAILDEHGTIIAVNSAWNRFACGNTFVGHLRGVSDNYLQLCDGASGDFSEEAALVAAGIRAVMAGEREEFHLEYPCHSPREQRWFVVRVTRFAGGGPVRAVVAHENITARKRAEEELRWKTAFLEAQVNASLDGILVVDQQGRKILQNQRFTELLKIPQHIADDEDDKERVRWVMDMTKHPDKFIERVVHLYSHPEETSRDEIELKDGVVLDRYSAPVNGKDGKYYGRIWTFRDITEQRRAEEALRASEANMAAAQRIAHFASWELNLTNANDVDANPLSWSDEMFRIAGYEPGTVKVSNELFFGLVPEEEHGLIRQAVAAAICERREYSIVHRLIRPNGEERIVHEAAQISFDDKTGQPLKMVGTTHDITEQRRAEESIRVQAHMLDHIGRAVIATDIDGQITYANCFTEELYGWAPAEILGQNIRDVTAPQTTREQTEQIMAQLQQGENWSGEFTVRHRDGTEFPVFVTNTPLRDGQGAVVGIVGISSDITKRKRAEEALRTSAEEFRTLAEALPQIVWVTRSDGWHLHFNQKWTDYTGLTLEESLGHGWLPPFHPDDQLRAAKRWQQATESGEAYEIEYRLRRADGIYHWMLGRALPMRDAAGDIVKWIGTCTDIHDLKLAELEISRTNEEIERLNADLEQRVVQRTEDLLAATQEAETANRAKSEFLSRTSHELRTPLNIILGFGQLLETEKNLGPEAHESIEQILRAGRHLLSLINEVLDISSAESGSMTLSLEPVAAGPLVEETLELVRPLAAAQHIGLEMVSPKQGHRSVLADRLRLKQALLNLLSNAIKYNRPGGKVLVECAAAEGADLPAVRFSVKDTGVGISAENLTRLFTPFDRLNVERTQTHIAGTGLGLALTKRMVELMGGRIGVESVPGEGSVFWIEAPMTESLTAPTAPTAPGPLPAVLAPHLETLHSRTLLYIDGDASNVRLITRILARRPAIRLLCAASADLGLESAHEHRPDFILLDPRLPDGDGEEVLARLGAHPRTANIPMAIISASILPEKREQMLAAGVCAFLPKPVEMRTVLSLLDQYIELPPVEAG